MLPSMAAQLLPCPGACQHLDYEFTTSLQGLNAHGQLGGLLQAPESFLLAVTLVITPSQACLHLQHLKEHLSVQEESVPDSLTQRCS